MFSPDSLLTAEIIGGVLILALVAAWVWIRRRGSRSSEAILRKAANDILVNFLIPDGNDSEILVQYALLCPRGILVIDVRDVNGNVFGSDAMDDWTVLSDRQRFTFGNPLHALYDRVAAVKRLVPDTPVTGFVAFTNRASFSKGQPTDVVMLDQLVEDLQHESKSMPIDALDAFYPEWNRLRDEAVAAQVGRLLRR